MRNLLIKILLLLFTLPCICQEVEIPKINKQTTDPEYFSKTLYDTLGCDSIIQSFYNKTQIFFQIP